MRLHAKFEGSATIVSIFRAILARFVIYKNGPKKTPKKFRLFFKTGQKRAIFGKNRKKNFFHHLRDMILGKVKKFQNDM